MTLKLSRLSDCADIPVKKLIMLRLPTGFGTAAQGDANITFLLSGPAGEVTGGTFEVAAP